MSQPILSIGSIDEIHKSMIVYVTEEFAVENLHVFKATRQIIIKIEIGHLSRRELDCTFERSSMRFSLMTLKSP